MLGNEKVLQSDPKDQPIKAAEKQPVVTFFAKIRDDYISKAVLFIIGFLFANVVSFITPDTANIEYIHACRDKVYDKSQRLKELEWQYKGENIEVMSSCGFNIYNRTSNDISGVRLYFSVKSKSDGRVPEILSKNLYPPQSLPRVGIKEVNEGIDNLYAFDIDVVKRTGDNYFYSAEFLFKGVSAPEMSVSTNNKDVTVEEFSNLRSLMRQGRVVLPIILPMLALGFWWDYRQARKRFSSFYNILSTDKRLGLSGEQTDIVLDICIDSLKYRPKSKYRKMLSLIERTK